MRLQRPIYVRKPVAEIQLRVVTRDLPDDSLVEVTDLQLQPGEAATGAEAPNPREVGSTAGRTQYRNGVIHDGVEVVILANVDRATPTRQEVRNALGETRVGTYRYGTLNGAPAYADARTHRADRGWGRPLVLTERNDAYLRTKVEGGNARAHLRLAWEDREP